MGEPLPVWGRARIDAYVEYRDITLQACWVSSRSRSIKGVMGALMICSDVRKADLRQE